MSDERYTACERECLDLRKQLTDVAATNHRRLEHVRQIALDAIDHLEAHGPPIFNQKIIAWRRSIDPSYVESAPLTIDQIDAIQRIGRDEKSRSTSISLEVLDALCETARFGARKP